MQAIHLPGALLGEGGQVARDGAQFPLRRNATYTSRAWNSKIQGWALSHLCVIHITAPTKLWEDFAFKSDHGKDPYRDFIIRTLEMSMRKRSFPMKIGRFFLAAAFFGLAFSAFASDSKAPDIKKQLFSRYDGKNMKVVTEKILVAPMDSVGGNPLAYVVNYDHFAPPIPKNAWPEKYTYRNLLDEFTTEEVKAGAPVTDPLTPGEMLLVCRFYVNRGKYGPMIDMYMTALNGKRTARNNVYSTDGSLLGRNIMAYGVHLRFNIPDPAAGTTNEDYLKTVTGIIDKYVMPADAYDARVKADEASQKARADAAKNVNIQPGMSKDEVVKILGEPVKAVSFGEKTILKYNDLSVELRDGKVVDVKMN